MTLEELQEKYNCVLDGDDHSDGQLRGVFDLAEAMLMQIELKHSRLEAIGEGWKLGPVLGKDGTPIGGVYLAYGNTPAEAIRASHELWKLRNAPLEDIVEITDGPKKPRGVENDPED